MLLIGAGGGVAVAAEVRGKAAFGGYADAAFVGQRGGAVGD